MAQHRETPDAPVDWGLFSSPDLLDWRWEGVGIGATAAGHGYSGSIIRHGGRVEAFHTVHDPAATLQHQVRLVAAEPSLRRWHAEPAAGLPPPTRNLRDPYVFRWRGAWRMLLANPCDWHDWRGEGSSTLRVLASDDLATWREAGRIGPWHPPGVMWEVPVLVERGGRDLLMISIVDRRADRARCQVTGWVGRFDGADFHPDDKAGEPVDLGPDFYAAMAGQGNAAPMVGWLSSWDTARAPVWPGFEGGPISLPRSIGVDGDRIQHRPLRLQHGFGACSGRPAAGLATAMFDGADAFTLTLITDRGRLIVTGEPRRGTLCVQRVAAAPFDWAADHAGAIAVTASRSMRLFVDGPAIELFIDPDARAVSAVLPGGLGDVTLQVGGRSLPLSWARYAGGGAARRSAVGVTP